MSQPGPEAPNYSGDTLQPGEFISVPDEYQANAEILEPEPINSVQRSPKPWHRPRKQLIRRQQWATSLSKLISDANLTGNVKYLGLPGDEFLDVRYLAGGPIADAELKLKFLGFNNLEAATAEEVAAVAEDSPAAVVALSALEETRNHEFIDSDSDIQPDDIRRLAKVGSPAYRRVDKFGPFDIVNLDLMQSVFAKDFQGDTYTAAIQHLFGLQARATHDWLLWVTTRVDRQAVNPSQSEQLLRLVQGRFRDCPELLELWTPDQFDASSPSDLKLNSCSERDFAAVVFIGMCLWLYGLGERPVPQPMTVISAFRYRVREDAKSTDMFSLVVRVSPKVAIPIDPTGLTPAVKPTPHPDRCAKLAQVMNRYGNSVDIEERIAGDTALRRQLTEETATLLELLRIDRAAYLSWVEQFPT